VGAITLSAPGATRMPSNRSNCNGPPFGSRFAAVKAIAAGRACPVACTAIVGVTISVTGG